jgi:hypothetical protein
VSSRDQGDGTGLALVVDMTTHKPRTRSLFSFLLATTLGLAVLGCDDGSGAGMDPIEETGSETSSIEDEVDPMDDEGGPLPDLGDVDPDDGGEGDEGGDVGVDGGEDAGEGADDGGEGDPVEPDVCGDGIVGPTEECDTASYELTSCEEGPGAYVCKPDCTLSDSYCGCDLGTEGCLCFEDDTCKPGLECNDGAALDICRPAPEPVECVERMDPCVAGDTCCLGLSCSPDTAGHYVCQ